MLWKLAVAVCLLLPLGAQAFVRTMAETGRPLFWTNPNVSLRVNPSNSSGLAEADVNTMISQAFQAWNTVPGNSARGNLVFSTGFPTGTRIDNINTIYFTSSAGRNFEPGVIAVTEVFYYLSDGRIAETDLSFNDQQFLFTNHAGDTNKSINGRTAIYLRDVATHEAGHVFGIDHSTVNLSSMIYTSFSGQFSLGGDDRSAVSSVYPAGGARGAINGNVLGRNGGIFGAHVEAINLATGKVEGAALANPDGSVRVGDLPPGKYALLVEPFGTSTYSISSYFQNVNHRFCTTGKFRRRFYAACGSAEAAVVEVQDGQTTNLGALTPSCTQMGNPEGAPDSVANAREVSGNGGAIFGTLSPGQTHYYKISGLSGDLEARAVAYAIYSPLNLRVRILNSGGGSVSGATSTDDIENPMPGGMTNYDSLATAANLTSGDYLLTVTASGSRVPASEFSAGIDLLDRDGHYLLAFGVNGNFGVPSSPDMSACISVNNRPQNASWRYPASTTREEKKKAAGCGTLGPVDSGPFSGGLSQLFSALVLIQIFVLMHRRLQGLVRRRR